MVLWKLNSTATQIHCSVLLPRTSAWFVRCTVQFSKNHRSSSDLIILPHSFRFVKCFLKSFFQGLVFIWLSICLCSPLCRATYEIISHLLLSVNWFFLRSFGLRLTGSWLKRVLLYQFVFFVSRVFYADHFQKGIGFRVQGCGGSFAAIYGVMPEGKWIAGFPFGISNHWPLGREWQRFLAGARNDNMGSDVWCLLVSSP